MAMSGALAKKSESSVEQNFNLPTPTIQMHIGIAGGRLATQAGVCCCGFFRDFVPCVNGYEYEVYFFLT